MLKKIRVFIAITILTLITFYFIDFTGLLSDQLNWLAKIQLIPAILALNIGVFFFVLALTFIFGRVYCSTICPMGIFQDVIIRISAHSKKKKNRRRFKFKPNKPILRFGVLGIGIISLLAGFTLIMALIEPYSAYGRISTHLIKPVYIAGNNLLATLTKSTGEFWFIQSDIVRQSMTALGISIFTFLVIGYLAWKHGRTYCNTICPAGTILGIANKYALFKVSLNKDLCKECGLCENKCKASCINSKEKTIDYSRCINCFNCLGSCKRGGVTYSFSLGKKRVATEKTSEQPEVKAIDTSRRQFLTTTVATAALAPVALAKKNKDAAISLLSEQKVYKRQHALSPPGSLSHKHLSQHCTSCHLCINRCPSKILKPSLLEYGLEGVMQPVISYEDNYCEFGCTTCADVCPNGAIKPITVEQKQRTQIGHAVFVAENCIVNTQQIKCGACSRKCPVNAITMIEGTSNGLKTPSIDINKCIGCGACEYICPTQPYRGIYVEGNAIHQFSHS